MGKGERGEGWSGGKCIRVWLGEGGGVRVGEG